MLGDLRPSSVAAGLLNALLVLPHPLCPPAAFRMVLRIEFE